MEVREILETPGIWWKFAKGVGIKLRQGRSPGPPVDSSSRGGPPFPNGPAGGLTPSSIILPKRVRSRAIGTGALHVSKTTHGGVFG